MNKLIKFSVEDSNDEVTNILTEQLNNTKIEKGFFEILNVGWQNNHEMTLPFDVSMDKVFSKVARRFEGMVELIEDDGVISFRNPDDGKEAETMVLHDMKDLEAVRKKVWK